MFRALKGLAVHIPQKTYRPGDTITGHVYRQVPVLVGEDNVKVTIALVGCSKLTVTEWSDHTGESQWTWTSHTRFLDPGDTSLTLHQGPLHISRKIPGLAIDHVEPQDPTTIEGGISWPFEIVIPRQTASKQVHMDKCHNGDVLPDLPSQVKECISRGEGRTVKVGSELPSHAVQSKKECLPFEFVDGYIHYFVEARLVSEDSRGGTLAWVDVTIENEAGDS